MEQAIIDLRYALDTFFLLMCAALVMWMAAGFALLEAGLVRAKNTTEILTKNVALYSVACLAYLVCGYALMYGGPVFLSGIGALGPEEAPGAAVNSPAATFFFQVVFVATSLSIVSGAVAERMKLWAFLAFAILMSALIYPLEGAWTWGGRDVFGLYSLAAVGFSDFAGSGIVHLAGASAALAGVLLLGPRKGKYRKDGSVGALPGANLPLAALGTLILWLGWFGFNGGSVLQVSDGASAHMVAMVFLNTNSAASAGLLAALATARLWFGKADLTMALNGALAGLVVITAEPTTPSALQAALFGGLGGALVVVSIVLLDQWRIDDPVGAISVHGVCGLAGLLLVPLTKPGTTLAGQLIGAATIVAWVLSASFLAWYLLKRSLGLRVSDEEEYEGLDIGECGLEAYPEFTQSR
ncbi:MAG: hypothetical protein R3348_01865 [Xanthomonadales bacterium]|nr:hypothetical protein [Xanthomonadales bacterium]